jgi:hypothetical protein
MAVPKSAGGDTFFGVPFSSLGATSGLILGGTRPTGDYAPFLVRSPIQISELSYQLTGITAGGTVDLTVRIYDADSDWQPVAGTGRLLATTTHTATGVTTVTGLSVSLPPGRYLTELLQESVSHNATMRVFGADVDGWAGMDLTAAAQNPGRTPRAANHTTGGSWTIMGSTGTTGAPHSVLYKWSLT